VNNSDLADLGRKKEHLVILWLPVRVEQHDKEMKDRLLKHYEINVTRCLTTTFEIPAPRAPP